MKHTVKRFLAVLLTVVMLATAFPPAAFAALLDNDPAYNQEILEMLESIAGSEEEAREYYAALQEYGLLDDDGNMIEEWTMEYHGKEITPDELREIVAGECDPNDIIWIDDTPYPLEDVAVMVQIEDYVQYIRETYFSDEEWTPEQIESYNSLLRQIRTKGLSVDPTAPAVIGPSGVNHAARVNVEVSEEDDDERYVTFLATLYGATAGQTVSFDWIAYSGSRPVSGTASGRVSITAGRDGTGKASFTVHYAAISSDSGVDHANPAPVRTPDWAAAVFYVGCRNLTDALFSNEKENVYFRIDTAGTVPESFFGFQNVYEDFKYNYYTEDGVMYSTHLNAMIRWGLVTDVEAYIDGAQFNTDFQAIVGDYNACGGDLAERDAAGNPVHWTDENLLYGQYRPVSMAFRTCKRYKLTDYPTRKSETEYVVVQKHAFTDLDGVTHNAFASYRLIDDEAPKIESLSVPAGRYAPGEIIPVVVRFSEPVQAHPTLVVNGVRLTAAETGPSNVMTFPYEVLEPDRVDDPATNEGIFVISDLYAKDLAGHEISGRINPNGYDVSLDYSPFTVNNVTLESINRKHVFTDVSARIDDTDMSSPKLVLTVGITDNEQLTQWMGSDFTRNPDGTYTSNSVKATVDGVDFVNMISLSDTITGGELVATFPLPGNTGVAAIEYTAELYLSDQLVFGKAAKAALSPIAMVSSEDIEAYVSVKQIDGVTDYESEDGTVWLQDYPRIRAYYKLKGSNFTYRDVTWSSLDTTIANIDADGRITPTGKSGKVRFRLTALNGGLEGAAAYKDTEEITFGTGLTPFLSVFTSVFNTVSGEPATVCWCSNICDKNCDADTTFTVRVKRGGTEVYCGTVRGNADAPAAAAVIPGDVLRYNYGAGAVNVFDVTISASYGGRIYSAGTSVKLKTRPATVRLQALENYSIVDTEGSFTVNWKITDFDRYSSDEPEKLFKLTVKKGKRTLCTIYDPMGAPGLAPEEEGVFNGSYTINDISVTADPEDKYSYRDIYTVTVEAKNGADSTWSRDSYILYVYDGDALKLWIDGEAPADGKFTMTNIPTIRDMSQDQRIALRRDISLRNIISANYGEYAWSELGDQLKWESSNNAVATLNYRQGAVDEDIRFAPYTTYRPTTDFTISGLSDGDTTITATHADTGMQAGAQVSVVTLKNKLYLFQCYPQLETTLTYTNGNNEKKSVTSNAKGEFAIFDEAGIKGDVHCRSYNTEEETAYVGSFSSALFETGERDSTKLELYPCNNLTLRRASYAYLGVKTPDGKPYTGKITLRGGVYLNGTYLRDALFAYNGTTVNTAGYSDCTVDLGSSGILEIVTDPGQWGLQNDQLSANDKISYTFLIKQGGGKADYYPVFAKIDADVSMATLSSTGQVTACFRKNDTKKVQPFVMNQTAAMSYEEDGKTYTKDPESVLNYTGSFGVSDDWTKCELNTVVLWWGQSSDRDNKRLVMHATYNDKERKVCTAADVDTSVQYNTGYDFVDECVTTYTVTIDEDHTDVINNRELKTPYLAYLVDGVQIQEDKMPFRLCNLIGAGKVEETDTLLGNLQQMGLAMSGNSSPDLSSGDKAVRGLIQICEGNYTPFGGDFQLIVTPTSDPTKFLGFASLNHDTKLGKQASYTDSDGMNGSVSETLPVITNLYKVNGRDMSGHMARVSGIDASKDARDIASLTVTDPEQGSMGKTWTEYKSDYLKRASQTSGLGGLGIAGGVGPKGANGARPVGVSGGVGGYVEFLIYYDFENQKWSSKVLDGGFNFSVTVSRQQAWTEFVGSIPITYGFVFGGSVSLNMDALTAAYLPKEAYDAGETTKTELANEYLWQLRAELFLKVFGGLGVSSPGLTLRIVAFAKVSFSFTFDWLKRPYLKKHPDAYILADGKLNPESEGALMSGQDYRMNLQIGLEFTFKLAFISYNKVLVQTTFSMGTSSGQWKRLNQLWKESQANLHWTIEHMLKSGSATLRDVGGQKMLAVDFAPKLEDRDYLENGGKRVWGERKRSGLFKAPATTDGLSHLESNTYPYADPELTGDGELLVWLSDRESTDVADTRAMFSLKDVSGAFAPGQPIDDAGCGDQNLTVDGTRSFAVAAWTRQTADLKKDAGAVLSDADQLIMLESNDVYAAVYDGAAWSAVCLDEEPGAGIAPTVAVKDGRAIVAWRSVAVGNTANITAFDKEDVILYKTYENGEWSETQSLYNGTSGNVKGLASAMMTDGAAAVAYTLDADGDDATLNDRDIVYTVVGPDGEVVCSVRPTIDDETAENPQIAAVLVPTEDGAEERFILGWYSVPVVIEDEDAAQTDEDGDDVADICLIDFDDQGITGKLLPHSLSQMAGETRAAISSNYRFAKNAETINDLSIVWSQRAEDQSEDHVIEKDVLKAVRFFSYGENNDLYDITCDLDVAEMPVNTTINHFAAYTDGNAVSAVLHASTNVDGKFEDRTDVTSEGETVVYSMPKMRDAMYTATDEYENKVEVPLTLADYETVRLGTDTLIQVDVENRGADPITAVSIDIGGSVTAVDGLFLLPGDTETIAADYVVPEDRIENPEYTVTATFDTGATTEQKTADGSVYLDYPDLEITRAEIVREEDGERDIRVTLNNRLDSKLKNSGRKVRISYWSDPTYENPIECLAPVVVTNNTELDLIDNGCYCCQVTFDVASYVKDESEEDVEIPASGLPVYIKVEVLKGDNTISEPFLADNTESVTCERLSVRESENVSVETSYSPDDNTAIVALKNLNIAPVPYGDLIVTLYDENGTAIEQKHTYTGRNGSIIELGKEEKLLKTVSFSATGAGVTARFVELSDAADNAELGELRFDELPDVTAESFRKQSDGVYEAQVQNGDLSTITVAASAHSIRSAISVKVNGTEQAADGAILDRSFVLTPGQSNTVEIVVTAENGATRTYRLTLRAETDTPPGPGDEPDEPGSGTEDLCPWCGQAHTGPMGGFIRFFHNIIWFFAHLFGKV